MLRSPARRTGFPAAGQENIPSHCPRHVTGSPCAPLGTMSTPTLATKENKDGCLAFYAKLPPASLTRQAWHWEGRPPSALMATNEPPSLAVGWPLRWKICGSPTEKKISRQTTVCGGGGEERTPSSPSEDGADSCRRPGAGLGSRREPVQCFGRGCAQLCPEECPLGKGCPRGTGLAQEPVSHPAACLGPGLALSSISPGKLQRGLPTALSSCSLYSLLLLPFSSSKNHFIVQTSVTERKRQSYAHTKPRDSVF